MLAALASAGCGGGTQVAQPRPQPRILQTLRRGHARGHAAATATERLAGLGLPVYCGGHSRRLVALTFDDGPGPYTKLAIRKLRFHHSRATFFLVGRSILHFPGLARRDASVAAIGDHTMTHPFLPALAPAAMRAEISDAKTLIERAARVPVLVFRPPYEGRTPKIDAVARSLGMLEVLWDVDSRDSEGADYAGIQRNVIAGLRPGAIVLMHENRGQTIRALPAIFQALADRHLRSVSVPALMALDPPSVSQLHAGFRGCR